MIGSCIVELKNRAELDDDCSPCALVASFLASSLAFLTRGANSHWAVQMERNNLTGRQRTMSRFAASELNISGL